MSIVAELKRRNVFRVALLYLVAAWVILQVAQLLFDVLKLPDWTSRLVLGLLALGFPLALIFSWVYELTPEGLKREHEVERNASITAATARKLDLTVVGLLVVAIVVVAVERFIPRTAPIPAATEAKSGASSAEAPVQAAAKSIAVLPFADMSAGKDQEYFADGLSEELLNLLAKLPELRVIGRTSSFQFKGKNEDLRVIGQKLSVAHILEGSVRKSGEKVRITAQLIRAADGSHLWSETYDRTLDDIFAVQDEIAAAVVEQLKLKLLGEAPKAKVTDPHAYALFLQARQLARQRTSEGLERSIVLYQQALAIDRNDAAAWDGLARNYLMQVGDGLRPIDEGSRLARDAVGKALAIDPDYALAHALQGRIAMLYDGDLAAAARHYEHALALEPTNTDVISEAGQVAQSLGRLDTAIALSEYVVSHDPVNALFHANMGFAYYFAGRQNEAIARWHTALALSPDYEGAQYRIGVALLLKGDPAGALAVLQKEDESWGLIGLPMAWHALGNKAKSDAALAELIRTQEKESAYNIAYVLAYRGDADRAFEWLDKAVAYHDPGLFRIAVEPLFANVHEDPRWLPFLRKIGRAPEQLAAIKFDVKVPR